MTSRTYRLIVAGELSDSAERAFDGMTLTCAGGTTTLTGTVRDQAELQGLLRRVSDLGLTLLETKAIDDGSDIPDHAERRDPRSWPPPTSTGSRRPSP